jgi:hypothetical protein
MAGKECKPLIRLRRHPAARLTVGSRDQSIEQDGLDRSPVRKRWAAQLGWISQLSCPFARPRVVDSPGQAHCQGCGLVCLPVSVGKSIRLYLGDRTPGGLLTAEIMNWAGHVVARRGRIWRRC